GVTSVLKPTARHRPATVSTGAGGGRAPQVPPGKHAGSAILGGHQPLRGGAAASSPHGHATLEPSITVHGRGSSAKHVSPAKHHGRLLHQPVRHTARSKR